MTVIGGLTLSGLASCSLRCSPGVGEAHSNLTVLADPSLSNCLEISGLDPDFTPPQASHQPALITFVGTSNLTLEDSQLLDINFIQLASIISFVNTTNVTVTNLTTSGCTVNQVLSFTSQPIQTAQVLIQSSLFSNLHSGGINATYTGLTVRDSVFENMHAADNTTVLGLLHHNNTDGSALAIHNCTFSNIEFDTLHPSGVIWSARPSVTLTDSMFTNCSTQYAVVSVYAFALTNDSYLSNETVLIDRCTFSNNSATQGILYHLGKDSNPSQELHLYNSQFVGNSASEGSGVTAFAVGVIRVVSCEFSDNWSSNGVSAFYVYGWVEQVTYFTMHDSSFRNNNGTRTQLVDNEGAGIIDTAECGGVYLSSCKCVGIMNSTFEGNIGIGACVHGQQGSSPDCALSDPVFFSQSTVAGPEAEPYLDDFLGFYDDLVITLDIRDSQFTSNTDAFLVREKPEPEQVQPIDFLTGGAGLDIQDVLFTVLSVNTFTSNRGRQGSALHLDTSLTTYVYKCSFDNNTATGQGGAVALVNSHSKGLLLANSNISNSQALFSGALYGAAGAQITISNSSQLVSNHAVSDGGAVYCQSCQQLTLEQQANLSSNTAGGSGGAVFCDGCILLQAHAVHFTSNSAGEGGAIGSSGNGYTLNNISHSLFQGNTALQSANSPSDNSMLAGGAVSVAGGVSVLVSNVFLDNKAGSYGGAIAYQDQCFTVYDTTGVSLESFLWAQLAPNLAALAGNCSFFISTANAFSGNHANIAGAVIFSTNLSSMQLTCAADSALQLPGTDCSLWTSSTSRANTVGADGIVGYGPGLAFPPAKIAFGGSASESAQINYISDGSSDVHMPLVTVLDQAGNTVKMQPLLANVTVAAVSKRSDGSLPQLPGQTQASGDANGTIAFADVVLIAQIGLYDLQVALPSFPAVPAAVLQVHVQPCGMGQVPNSDQTQCTLCPSSSYSFDPGVKDCKACPHGATCIGGATLVPQQHFWHSAPDSDHIVACPNNNACAGDTAALLACQNATYSANLNVNQASASFNSSCLLNEPWTSSNPGSYMRQLCTHSCVARSAPCA